MRRLSRCHCGPLLKAIDAYIQKADDKLADALEEEGYQDPQQSVRDASRLEDDVADALREETRYFISGIESAVDLDVFAASVWPDLKLNDGLRARLAEIFKERLSTYVPHYISRYLKQTDKMLRLGKISQRTVTWVDSWSEELAGIMQLNSHGEVEDVLVTGLKEGFGIEEFSRRLLDSGIRNERYKARRVALTEVLRAHSVAQQEAFMQSPSVKEKMWKHTGAYRNDPRQNHVDMDGKRVPVAEPFELTGADGHLYRPMYPRDTILPAGESINCHCLCQPVVDEDVLGMSLEERRKLQQQAIDEMDEEWERELDARNRAKAGIEAPAEPEAKRKDTSDWVYAPSGQDGHTDDTLGDSTTLGQYMTKEGKFDLDRAKKSYEKFLQNVPESCKLYLRQAMDAVEYLEKTDLPDLVFAYNSKLDAVGYNPKHPDFTRYSFEIVNTHELSHRINAFFVKSWENKAFSDAIEAAGVQKDVKWDEHTKYCDANDKTGFLSDILSALCNGKYDFPYGHNSDYWGQNGNRQDEVFANLFSLISINDLETIDYLRQHFPKVVKEYEALEFSL